MTKKIFLALAVFDFALYLAMKSIWSGIQGMTGVPWLALFLFFLLLGIAVAQGILVLKKRRTAVPFVLGGLSVVLTAVLGYMLDLGIGSLRFFLLSFLDILLGGLVLLAAYALFFRYPKSVCATKPWYRRTLMVLVVLLLLVVGFRLDHPFLSAEPAVYAVGEDYQIVWTTTTSASGTVRVGNRVYEDVVAGSLRTESVVHKVVVPMAALDAAGSYTIRSTHYLYRGPYSGVAGTAVARTYDFRPVDDSDGIAFYTLSDVHEWGKAALAAVSSSGAPLDFLVLAGDLLSTYETTDDLDFLARFAHQATDGAIPILFARGNHDVKGAAAQELSHYVGATATGDFFYGYRLGPVAGVVLDLGEDHDDDWWEFYGLADFTAYRARETAFLQDLVDASALSDPTIRYRLAVCHMPLAYVEETGFLTTEKIAWTALLDALATDVVVSGHLHELFALGPWTTTTPLDPLYFDVAYRAADGQQGFRTDAGFAQFVACRRSLVQDYGVKEDLFGGAFTGLLTEVDFDSGTSTSRYTNSLGDVVPIVDPFAGTVSTTFVVPLA